MRRKKINRTFLEYIRNNHNFNSQSFDNMNDNVQLYLLQRHKAEDFAKRKDDFLEYITKLQKST